MRVDVVAGAAEASGELVVGEAEVGEAFAKGGDLGPGEGALEGAAAAGHGDAALAAVTPAGGDGEVADGGVELAPEDRGEHADRAQLVANGAGGDCVNRLLDVEERRDGAAELGGYGYCASHSRWFWGFRLHLLAAPDGTPRALELADPRRDEREVGLELLARCRGGCELLICDKGYAGREFAAAAADLGVAVARPARADEPGRGPHLAPIRQRIESIFWTCKDLLTLERHGARTMAGLRERILSRFLCLAACISLNHRLGRPSRALVDYCA